MITASTRIAVMLRVADWRALSWVIAALAILCLSAASARISRAQRRGAGGAGRGVCRRRAVGIRGVILYPVQTAANLIAYESGYYGAADVARLGFAMLGLTIAVSLCIAVPYWSALGLQLMAR